jgi:BirA family biotin operon repressor/biotin-[acetyl-CoA-carboxylase] ligase
MRIIKVNAIPSTNDFARELYRQNGPEAPLCVVALDQTRGRGQRGAGWQSNPGENLTFSLLFSDLSLKNGEQFLLSAAVSIAIQEFLIENQVPNPAVKWPNDIMSGNKKLAGVLIENILKQERLAASIIGIGLNVNQIEFPGLPRASSLKKLSGNHFSTGELLPQILKFLEAEINKLQQASEKNKILSRYSSKMFRKDVVSTFKLPNGTYFSGIIRGISSEGLLKVETDQEIIKFFDLKEVQLQY